MTKEDIIRMAREAGWGQAKPHDDCRSCGVFDLERFAALVAEAERERVMSEPINKAHWQKFESEIRADERDRAMRENAYVLAERDAILELVDSYAKNNTDLADAIRARGQA